jgi:hypothetical protein
VGFYEDFIRKAGKQEGISEGDEVKRVRMLECAGKQAQSDAR